MQIPRIALQKNSNSTEIVVLQYAVYTKKDIFKKKLKKIKESKKVWDAINAIINNNKNKKNHIKQAYRVWPTECRHSSKCWFLEKDILQYWVTFKKHVIYPQISL